MGRYCSPYGYALPTPNMDRLARSGTVFRQAHCQSPTCSPSRAALLTGETAHQSGMTGLLHRGFYLKDSTRHLGYFLGQQGYHTAYAGVQHEFHGDHGPVPYQRKLAAPEEAVGNRDEQTAAAVEIFIKEPPENPFFLWVGMFWPHREFLDAAASPHEIPAIRPPEGFPDRPELRGEMRDYAASVACADTCLGRVLDALESSGLADETIVLVTTDHGIPYPGMKCQLTDGGTGVALITRFPQFDNAPTECDTLVSHLDVYPTICDILGLPTPAWLQGHSLRPLLDGTADSVRDAVFAEVNYHACYDPGRSIRTERYKLIKLFGDPRTVLANIDDGPAKRFLMERGLGRETLRDSVQLYDLDLDPAETRNLADHPDYRAIRGDLESRLETWMEETADPLLHGPMPLPPTAKLNRLSDPHPDVPSEELINAVSE